MTDAVKKRPYRSSLRQEQAARTRARIVEAAAELFLDAGYALTTVRMIAERANVAPDTVYAVFETKVRILTAVIDARLAPSGAPNVTDRTEAQAVRHASDQRQQLRLFARDIAGLSTRVRPVYEILRTASAVEPEAHEVFVEMERHRLANMTRVATWLQTNGKLAVTTAKAGEIIFVLASPDVARMLCDVLGWSEKQHAAWLEQSLSDALLRPT